MGGGDPWSDGWAQFPPPQDQKEQHSLPTARLSTLSLSSTIFPKRPSAFDVDEEKKGAEDGEGVPPLCYACNKNHPLSHPFTVIDCSHTFSAACLSAYINGLVAAKRAVDPPCPHPRCRLPLSHATIQAVLSPAEHEAYLQATLMAFIDADGSSFICPNGACKSVISIAPFDPSSVGALVTEKDDEGEVLSREAYLHYCEFRVRCRDCNLIFCAQCLVTPYHKGYTCAQYVEYQAARHCRFCASRLDASNQWRHPAGAIALKDVCTAQDCVKKAEACCERMLSCGCPCNGIKGEKACLPCLKHDLAIEEEFCPICTPVVAYERLVLALLASLLHAHALCVCIWLCVPGYVEALKDAPCIKMTGPCTHVAHYACVLTKIESRWPGARISFEFRTCPVCKQNLAHPALEAVLAPIIAMEQGIIDKALQRLKYEGRESDPAISVKGGEFFNNPTAFAMKQYLFYQCFKCARPYFAGGYQCVDASAQGFDPSELICPSCQPSSVEDCIAEGTAVALADGTSLPIERVRVGMQVLARHAAEHEDEADGLTPLTVTAVLDRGMRPCVELLFSDGRVLVCTGQHRLLTADGRWIAAADLVVNSSEIAVRVRDHMAERPAADHIHGMLDDLVRARERRTNLTVHTVHCGGELRADSAEAMPEVCKWKPERKRQLAKVVHASRPALSLKARVVHINIRRSFATRRGHKCFKSTQQRREIRAAVTTSPSSSSSACCSLSPLSSSPLTPQLHRIHRADDDDTEDDHPADSTFQEGDGHDDVRFDDGSSDDATHNESRVNVDDGEELAKATRGVHRHAHVLPLSRVKLVGRRAVGQRHVYDLTVPSPQGADSCSFTANGLLVHNCKIHGKDWLAYKCRYCCSFANWSELRDYTGHPLRSIARCSPRATAVSPSLQCSPVPLLL